jgi:hypothetical protein
MADDAAPEEPAGDGTAVAEPVSGREQREGNKEQAGEERDSGDHCLLLGKSQSQ